MGKTLVHKIGIVAAEASSDVPVCFYVTAEHSQAMRQ